MARLGRPPSVLTYAQAEEIRRRYRPGLGGQLAREFGIRNNYLLDVIAGRVHKPPEERCQRQLAMTDSAIRQRRYYARKRGELPPYQSSPPRERPARRGRKLTDAQIAEIGARAAAGFRRGERQALARRWGVTPGLITYYANGGALGREWPKPPPPSDNRVLEVVRTAWATRQKED